MKRTLPILLLIFICGGSGCTRMAVFPPDSLPPPLRQVVYVNSSEARGWLHCLNVVLRRMGRRPRVTIDPIPVTAAPGGGLALPQELRPYVADALRAFDDAFQLVDTSTITGVKGMWQHLPEMSAVPESITRPAITTQASEPYIVIRGSVYDVQETKATRAEIELFGLGFSGEIRCYDVSFELESIERESNSIVGGKSFTVRFFGATDGVTMFRLLEGDLLRSNIALVRAPNLRDALQYLADYTAAALWRTVASKLWGIDCAVCDSEIPGGRDNSRLPFLAKSLPSAVVFSLFPNQLGELCVSGGSSPEGQIYLTVLQYATSASSEAPLGSPFNTRVFQAEEILGGNSTCFSQSIIDPITKTVRVEAYDANNNTFVGSGLYAVKY